MSEDLKPLRQHGTPAERRLLGSASEDQPSARVRSQAIASLVGAQQRRRRQVKRTLAALATGVAVAAAAGFAIVEQRARDRLVLSAEPQLSLEPSAASSKPLPPSASGVSPFVPCTPLAVAAGNNPLIDDFEDGDALAPMLEHRAGQWLTINDGTGTQLPKPATIFFATRIPGGRGSSQFGIHSVGGKFTKWGANLSLEFSPHRCYDASAYAGIQFWARGHGELRAVVQMTQVVTEEFGGTCTHDCYDAHAKLIKLARDFQHFTIRWEDLRQQGFGQPMDFDARSLHSMQFAVPTDQTPFDFWIDDVSFIQRQ